MTKRERELEYRRLMGDEAADRQARLAGALRSCCGTAPGQPHVDGCRYGRQARQRERAR